MIGDNKNTVLLEGFNSIKMKITLEQLPNSLKNQIHPLYLVSGDEPLLVNEACDLIRKEALNHGALDRMCFDMERGFVWSNFVSAIKNFSLLSKRKLIELRLDNAKLDLIGAKVIQNYVENPSKDNVLLIITPKLPSTWPKTNWIKQIESKGVLLQVWPIEFRYLPSWIAQRFKQRELKVDMEICKFFADKMEGNLLAINQEIEKLSILYDGKSTITLEQVVKAISNNAKYTMFDLIDHALDGNAEKVVYAINALKNEGTEPSLMLWALSRELRTLINASLLVEKGYTLEKAIQEQAVFAKHVPLVKKALQKQSTQKLKLLLASAAKIDCLIKGVLPGNVWDELLQTLLNLAGIYCL